MTPATMLLAGPHLDFAAQLAEVERCGAAKAERTLSPEAQRALLAALEAAAFEPAPERVGDVRQQFELLMLRLPAVAASRGQELLLALAEEYGAFIREQARALNAAWLADFAPTDIYVQRYRPGALGITPHRDSRRFVKLISVFSLGAGAELRICRDRQGSPLRRYPLASGDLLLLRAPGFAGEASAARPLHSVSAPRGGVRYSISLRMVRQSEAAAGIDR